MGSPYLITCVGRVNVIKTSKGFARFSREMCSQVQVDFLDNVITLVADIIECPTDPRWAGVVSDDVLDNGVGELRSSLASECRNWHPFVPSYLDLCEFAIACKIDRARRVITVQSNISFEDSRAFNRAVVLDFTLKGN